MDFVNVNVTSNNTEDASLVAGVINDALVVAGFNSVEMDQSILSIEQGSTLSVLAEVAPHLFDTPINITYGVDE